MRLTSMARLISVENKWSAFLMVLLLQFFGVYIFLGMVLQPHHFKYPQYHPSEITGRLMKHWPFSGVKYSLMGESSESHVNIEPDTVLTPAFPNAPVKKDQMNILIYTKFFSGKWHKLVEILTAEQCNHLKTSFSTHKTIKSNLFSIPCRITSEQKYFNDSDAVIFHSQDLPKTELPKGHRNEKQLWVYWQLESEVNGEKVTDLRKYPDVFNWTMTYRRDSDVYQPYGYLIPHSVDGSSNASDFLPSTLTNKTGVVAWIVSRCHPNSKREYFVRELQKYITVDIFGKCGQKCPTADCYGYVASKYKMYLSFENSLCTDYVTEKFYRALLNNMLPIVYGGGKGEPGEDYQEVAPAGSYINARAFNSPKDLANYLLYLNKNDSAFLEYFQWKRKFQSVYLTQYVPFLWCNICQRLYEHVNKLPTEFKLYKDLWSWWRYVDEKREVTAGGNKATLQLSGPAFKEKTRACVSPPNKLIGDDGR